LVTIMTDLVLMIARSLVDHPEKVVVTIPDDNAPDVIRLQVASEDMGKVIGKQGRIAKAIRTVVKAAGIKDNKTVSVEILSEDELAEIEQ